MRLTINAFTQEELETLRALIKVRAKQYPNMPNMVGPFTVEEINAELARRQTVRRPATERHA